MPLQHRHGYAAGLHRGLPTGDINRPKEFADVRVGCARHASPHPPGWSWSCRLRSVLPLVSHVHLLVLLAGPEAIWRYCPMTAAPPVAGLWLLDPAAAVLAGSR